jgi:hypothetical protein
MLNTYFQFGDLFPNVPRLREDIGAANAAAITRRSDDGAPGLNPSHNRPGSSHHHRREGPAGLRPRPHRRGRVGQLVPDLRHRGSLVEVLDADPDGEDLAAWLGLAFAPPRLTNREGEDLMLCRAVLRPRTTPWDD